MTLWIPFLIFRKFSGVVSPRQYFKGNSWGQSKVLWIMFSRQYYLHPQLFWTVTNSIGDKFYAVVSCQNFHCYPWMAHSCIVLISFTPTMTSSPDYASLTSLLWHTATYQGLSKVNFSSSFPSSQSQLSIPRLWLLIGWKVKTKEKGTAEGRTCNTGLVFTNDIECFLRPRQWFGEKQKPEPGFSLLKHCTMRAPSQA